MKLEAYGEYIVAKEVKTQTGSFVVNEFNRAEVLSIGNCIEGIDIGDILYYRPGGAEKIQEYLLIHLDVILCKVLNEE